MVIALDTLFLIPKKVGGTEIYARHLIRALGLVDRKNHYLILTNVENHDTWDNLPPNFERLPCPFKGSSKPLRVLYEQLFLSKRLNEIGIDVLHSLGYTAPLQGRHFISIVTIGDLIFTFFPKEFSFIQRNVAKKIIIASARRADRIITFSKHSKQDVVRVCQADPDKIDVISLAPAQFSECPDEANHVKDDRVPYIFSASSTYFHKNLIGLLEAFAILRKNIDCPHRLVVSGLSQRAERDILKKVRALKLEEIVEFVGWVEQDLLLSLYKNAALFVYPSLYEGFGLPVLEAMMLGVPAVSSNLTSLPEVCGDGALLIDPRNPEVLADAIAQILRDPKLRGSLIERGYHQAHQFSWERCATETIASYQKAITSAKELNS